MYKILVADDDPSIVRLIREMLKDEYEIITAGNGEEALREAGLSHPDLVIMDVMMPKMNGIAATMHLREHSNCPVLILSAKAESSDRVVGLQSGADDYLVKPFCREELQARVQALLRRYDCLGSIRENETTKEGIAVGDILLNTEKKVLVVRGETVSLTATEFRILHFLMQNPGHVFSAEEIYAHAWDSEAYSVENTVMVHINRIRKKTEINPRKPEHLKVIWGIGYVFE